MLDERILRDEFGEILLAREVVGDALFLAVAGTPRCVRDGEAEAVGVGGEEAFEEGRFAGAGRPGDDDWSGEGGLWREESRWSVMRAWMEVLMDVVMFLYLSAPWRMSELGLLRTE
jgi:hypothetical protein